MSGLAADPLAPGQPLLFLPSRLHRSSPDPISTDKFPLSSDHGPTFPFEDPLCRSTLGYPVLKLKPMHRAPLSTKPNHTTKSAPKVNKLPKIRQLNKIQLCSSMWDHMKKWCGEGIDMGPKAPATFFRPGVGQQQYLNTWTAFCTRPVASAGQQADAIYALHGLSNYLAVRKEAVVNGEEAVQDEVQVQILQMMNLFAQASILYHIPNSYS